MTTGTMVATGTTVIAETTVTTVTLGTTVKVMITVTTTGTRGTTRTMVKTVRTGTADTTGMTRTTGTQPGNSHNRENRGNSVKTDNRNNSDHSDTRDMCILGRRAHIIRNIMCSFIGEHILVVICVIPLPAKHISLVICVSRVGEQIN